MKTSTNIRRKAIDLIEKLPPSKLGEVITFLEGLSQENSQSSLNTNETDLISIIKEQKTLEIQERLEKLRDAAEWSDLTPEEYQELLEYEDLQEQHNAKRLEALIKLAVLRNTDLASLNHQFQADVI